jgi:hypothetical protein
MFTVDFGRLLNNIFEYHLGVTGLSLIRKGNKMSITKKLVGIIAAAALSLGLVSQAAATPVALSGIGSWDSPGVGVPGALIDLGGGVTSMSFTSGSGTLQVVADDCCIIGDAFGLILDGAATAWSFSDTVGSSYGPGYFHGVYTGLISAGAHAFSLYVTQDCCGSGGMAWSASVTPVPEPETYAMLLVGLGLVGFMMRRRREDFSF